VLAAPDAKIKGARLVWRRKKLTAKKEAATTSLVKTKKPIDERSWRMGVFRLAGGSEKDEKETQEALLKINRGPRKR
jgi:hypothetical protein